MTDQQTSELTRRERNWLGTIKQLRGERDAFAAELDEAREALRDAVWAAEYLAEQQAMPDDGYVERLDRARAALARGEEAE